MAMRLVTVSTMNYQPGDLVLVAFPYSRGTQFKQRPAVVVVDTGDADIVAARVTTQTYLSPHDVTVSDWKGAGLLAPSVVRTHKLATIEKTLIRLRLGGLQTADRRQVSAALRQTFNRW